MNESDTFEDISTDMFTASIKCIPIILLLIIILIPLYIYIYGVTSLIFAAQKLVFGWWLVIPIIIAGIFAHEGLHAIVFGMFSDTGFEHIHIGIQWHSLTPYAHYKKPLKAIYYRIALLAPAVILGVVPIIVGLIFHCGPVFIIGLLFLLFSGGDLLIMWLIRKVPYKTLVKDHPTRAGCYVYLDSTDS
ncbi:MAG: DUF3267 domain-containing protein [Candidatus Cloacimonetes bacterium]|nr:DUF3267 domain-containing protein [Candidatus Cloacimonadota bacterium]